MARIPVNFAGDEIHNTYSWKCRQLGCKILILKHLHWCWIIQQVSRNLQQLPG